MYILFLFKFQKNSGVIDEADNQISGYVIPVASGNDLRLNEIHSHARPLSEGYACVSDFIFIIYIYVCQKHCPICMTV